MSSKIAMLEAQVRALAHRLTVGIVQLDALSGKPMQEMTVGDLQYVRSYMTAPETSAFGKARGNLRDSSMAYEMAQEEVRDILRESIPK